jgi:predicted nucleotidyltransferase
VLQNGRDHAHCLLRLVVTAEEERLVTALVREFERDVRIDAAFLTGSRARGDHDDHSDIDLLVFAADASIHEVGQDLERVVAGATPIVDLARRLIGSGLLYNVVTAKGRRVDVAVAPSSAVATTQHWGDTRVLFDRADIAQRLPVRSPPYRQDHDTDWVIALTKGVLRTLLLLPMLVDRHELLRGSHHVQLLKQDLLELLLHRAGDPPIARPGIWAWSELNHRLPAADRELVASLPPAGMTAPAVIDGHLSVAAVFLPIARQLVEAGRPWPLASYEAAVRHLLEEHGLELW